MKQAINSTINLVNTAASNVTPSDSKPNQKPDPKADPKPDPKDQADGAVNEPSQAAKNEKAATKTYCN